jgi:hypothetical protein
LERFCKSVTKGQLNGDWEQLYSIVLEKLCSLDHDKVIDLWSIKDGCTTPLIWVWLFNTARIQATGNRTQYQREVIKPAELLRHDVYEIADCIEYEFNITDRLNYENNLSDARDKFCSLVEKSEPLTRVILESYLIGNMNASEICRRAGVPYNYYLSKLHEIYDMVEVSLGVSKPHQAPKITHIPRPATGCKRLIYVSTHFKRPSDVPNWKRVSSTFVNREKRLYRQQTLFPIKQFLPPVFRKLSIA